MKNCLWNMWRIKEAHSSETEMYTDHSHNHETEHPEKLKPVVSKEIPLTITYLLSGRN